MAWVIRNIGYAWVAIAVLVVTAGHAQLAAQDGLLAMLAEVAPWNIVNYLVIGVLVTPGLLILRLAQRIAELEAAAPPDAPRPG